MREGSTLTPKKGPDRSGCVWEGRLFDFDTLADAHQLPEDIYRQAAPALVFHRDI